MRQRIASVAGNKWEKPRGQRIQSECEIIRKHPGRTGRQTSGISGTCEITCGQRMQARNHAHESIQSIQNVLGHKWETSGGKRETNVKSRGQRI